MYKTVNASHIYEQPIVGNVLDHALEHGSLLEARKDFVSQGNPLCLQDGSTRQHNISPAFVVLYDLKFMFGTHKGIHIPHRPQIHLGARKECLETDIHREPAFDPRRNLTFNGPVIFINFLDFIPNLDFRRFFLGKPQCPLFILSPL